MITRTSSTAYTVSFDDALDNKAAWLVFSGWRRLHYFSWVSHKDWDNWIETDNFPIKKAICGYMGQVDVPGMLSRMGRKRCGNCCDKLKITRGYGTPVNDKQARRVGSVNPLTDEQSGSQKAST